MACSFANLGSKQHDVHWNSIQKEFLAITSGQQNWWMIISSEISILDRPSLPTASKPSKRTPAQSFQNSHNISCILNYKIKTKNWSSISFVPIVISKTLNTRKQQSRVASSKSPSLSINMPPLLLFPSPFLHNTCADVLLNIWLCKSCPLALSLLVVVGVIVWIPQTMQKSQPCLNLDIFPWTYCDQRLHTHMLVYKLNLFKHFQCW